MAGGIVFSSGRAWRSDELYGNGQHYFSVDVYRFRARVPESLATTTADRKQYGYR